MSQPTDSDVYQMVLAECQIQLRILRDAIREHRDQRLDDRCWEDDFKLYAMLPEGLDPKYVDISQLPKAEMMRNCDRYTTCRTLPGVSKEQAIEMYKALQVQPFENTFVPATTTVSVPLIRLLKDKLAYITLLFLGQHLWSTSVHSRKTDVCLCRCCNEARRAYQVATGAWPTNEQEHTAMKEWGR